MDKGLGLGSIGKTVEPCRLEPLGKLSNRTLRSLKISFCEH
jgi:hypothetical protein